MFATAYGNLGSSIYYSLGLVAAYALGLTPVVFMFAGGLFALTAKTYAETASMFPEAGGSSSFARHAINEVASFVAGWALSLDYIITIAISAFFVPHYLSAFWAPLGHNPGEILGGMVVIALLVVVNIRGLRESAKLNIGLAIADLFTQVVLVAIGAVFALHPALLVRQVHLGIAPTASRLLFAVSISMLAYTGIETVSNMAEEARDPGRDVPRTVNLLLVAVLGVYAGMTTIGISALPVDPRLTYRLEHRQPPAWFKELEYGSALVPLFSSDVDGSALRAAAKLVGPEATVDCVYVLRVPAHLPLDARLDDEEQIGRGVCEAARIAGRRAGVKKVQTRLLRARNPGAALVEEAQRNRSEIIYLGTAHAPAAERALGPLATYLLGKRPCRIVIESGPAGRDVEHAAALVNGDRAVAARNGARAGAPS
jgi:nucleotide-binding universal stress UspA family protein